MRRGGRDVDAGPDHVVGVEDGGGALGVGHRRPEFIDRGVEGVLPVDVREARQLRAGRLVEEAGEAQAVAELVEQHGRQVDLGAVVVVQAVVPADAGEAAGLAEGAPEQPPPALQLGEQDVVPLVDCRHDVGERRPHPEEVARRPGGGLVGPGVGDVGIGVRHGVSSTPENVTTRPKGRALGLL